MITILNRKEVCVTFDMARQAEVRDILQGAGIDYRVKVINRTSTASVRASMGSSSREIEMDYEYRIFVHKDDYEEALHLIRR